MKTKNFFLFSTSVFLISLFLIVFHSQPPESLQNIVTQTHQHIKDFQVSVSVQESLREAAASAHVAEARYSALLGLADPPPRWHNTTTPVLVTYARGDDHAQAVGFVRDAARLPYTVLLYDLGLTPASLLIISNFCNSSKCAIVDFDLEVFPSHVSDETIRAFRPLIIQHALSRVGGVIFSEASQRWAGSVSALEGVWERAGRGAGGVVAWRQRAAVTSLTHPRMFRHLRAAADDFLFVPMVDAARVVLRAPAALGLARAWGRCALTLDCIMPLGAQAGGCKFDKKPQYRYSGCHERDASALSILLGLRGAGGGAGGGGGGGAEDAQYAPRAALWRSVGEEAARAALAALLRNVTLAERDTPAPSVTAPTPRVTIVAR